MKAVSIYFTFLAIVALVFPLAVHSAEDVSVLRNLKSKSKGSKAPRAVKAKKAKVPKTPKTLKTKKEQKANGKGNGKGPKA